MTNGDHPDDFSDVFSRDSSDMGADTAAPVEQGQPRDEAGRFAPKGPEAQAQETPPPSQEATPDATSSPASPPSERQPRNVPLPELLKERERYKSEATLRAEAEKRAADLQAQFEALQRQLQMMQQPPPQREQEQEPDPYADPAAYARFQEAKFERQLANERANMSEMIARQKHGDAAVEAAQQAALNAGVAGHFLRQRDPYGALMQWHRTQSFLQKVGADPDAYEKTIEQRAYEKALADLKAGKVPLQPGAQPAQSQPQRFPGSLASATATGTGAAVLSDEAAFSDVFSNRRA